MKQLLIGCGRRRDKRVWLPSNDPQAGAGPASNRVWENLYTLDNNPACCPDIVCDLSCFEWFGRGTPTEHGLEALKPHARDQGVILSNFFDEVHAYEVLEHLGSQGDERAFFAHFSEIWRILKPGGHLLATCPSRYSEWLWGDPSHKRAILPATLIFLNQTEYVKQCDREESRTPMSDFRDIYRADFDIVYSHDNRVTHSFILRAVKPSRVGGQVSPT